MKTKRQIENEIEGLEQLVQDTSEYRNKVYDWVSCLHRVALLETLRDFQEAAEARLAGYKKELADFEAQERAEDEE